MSQDQSSANSVQTEDQAPSPTALDTDAPPADETAPPPAAPKAEASAQEAKSEPRPTGGFATGLVGGAVATAVVVAGITAAWPFVRDQLLGSDGMRIAQLERQSDELTQKVALLQGQVSSQTDGAGATLSNGLNQRLTSVEQRLNSADEDPRLTSLSKKLDDVTADNARTHDDMEKLRNAIPPEGLILRLAERAESAEKAAREISSQHAQAQALLLVVGQLRDAIDRGDPYEYELHAVRRVAPPEEEAQLDALERGSAAGLPRRTSLLNSLPLLAPTILRAGVLPEDGSIWQRAAARLASMVTVRRIDGTGSDTASVLARAQAAARDGDLSKAVQELSALDGASAEAAAPWLKDAQSRLTVDKALSMLSADAMAISGKLN